MGLGFHGAGVPKKMTARRVPIKQVPVKQVPVKAAPTRIAYYNPSRVIKDIKVVSDLRQNGAERGETQTGDNGALGPVPTPPIKTPVKIKSENKLVPIALAIGALLLFGG